MHHRFRPTSRSWRRSVPVSIVVSVSLLISLCAPLVTRDARAQGLIPVPTPTPPLRAGQPPGPDLPNLDVMRTLQSVTPVVTAPFGQPPPGVRCEEDCGGGGEPPVPPNDPNYSTPRTRPTNRTGEPGITLGSRTFNWNTPLVSLSGRSGFDSTLS